MIHINRTENPFIRPSLFRNNQYRNMLIVTFFSVNTFFGMIFLTPLMLRALNAIAADGIGLVFFPGAMSAAITANIGGKIVDKKGSEPVLYAGMAMLTTGFVMLSVFAGMSPRTISLNLILCYIGFSLIQSSIAHKVSTTLPSDQLGIGMGIYNLVFFMSGAFSAAVIGKMLDISQHHPPLNPLAMIISSGPYSNLFLLLAVSVLLAALLFYGAFGKDLCDK
jgi:DHA2 family metal-tetracycline-proton antiporter-like MFS transporter